MIGGLDLMRVLALALITWQHAASNLGYYEVTQWRGISPGQTGVAVFCAISGLLAFREKPFSVLEWLKKRLARIFPAYWVVTIAAFLLALITSIKKLTVGLFLSQMIGLGYFTHGWDLVNVVSWFISLLLLCYIIAAVSWFSGKPVVVLCAVTVITAFVCLVHVEVAISRHLISFGLAGIAVLVTGRKTLWLLGILLLAVGIYVDPSLFYPGISLLMVMLIICRPFEELKWISQLSNFSYEYFLVHGIFLVGMTRLVSVPTLSVSLAIALSAVASVVLHHVCQPAVLWAMRCSKSPDSVHSEECA